MGLAVEMPGMAVFHLMLRPLVTSQSATAPCPSPLPDAASPRNDGQLRAAVIGAGVTLAGPCTMVSEEDGPPLLSKDAVRFGISVLPKLVGERATSGTAGCPW